MADIKMVLTVPEADMIEATEIAERLTSHEGFTRAFLETMPDGGSITVHGLEVATDERDEDQS